MRNRWMMLALAGAVMVVGCTNGGVGTTGPTGGGPGTVTPPAATVFPTGVPVASKGAVNAVPMAAAPVTVDGVLDEPCWTRAIAFGDFTLNRSDKPKVESRVLVLHDKDNLYLAIINDEPNTDQLVTKATARDGAVWEDDSIEVYIDAANEKEREYSGFFVNAANVVYDRRRIEDWNGEWKSATKVHAGKAWVAELAIPWKTLEVTYKAGHRLGLMVARNRVCVKPSETLYLVPCAEEAKDTTTYPVLELK